MFFLSVALKCRRSHMEMTKLHKLFKICHDLHDTTEAHIRVQVPELLKYKSGTFLNIVR